MEKMSLGLALRCSLPGLAVKIGGAALRWTSAIFCVGSDLSENVLTERVCTHVGRDVYLLPLIMFRSKRAQLCQQYLSTQRCIL